MTNISTIAETTGVKILPEKVRLRPSARQPYHWTILKPECKQFFDKKLSDHPQATIRAICEQLGKGFMATSGPPQPGGAAAMVQDRSSSEPSEGESRLSADIVAARLQINYLEKQLQAANELLHRQIEYTHYCDSIFDRLADGI